MTVRLLSGGADILPSDIDDANFAFYGKYLQGREKQRDRWQRGVAAVEGSLGEALGKIYVERHFPPSSKAAMEELVGNLRLAMADNLKDLAWMTPAAMAGEPQYSMRRPSSSCWNIPSPAWKICTKISSKRYDRCPVMKPW